MIRFFLLILALPMIASCQTPKSVFWWGNCPSVEHPESRVVVINEDGYFRASRPNELVGCIEVPKKIDPSKMKVVLSVFLGDLRKGDELDYSSVSTLTNDSYSDNWMLSRFLVLANDFDSIDGVNIRRAHGYNCTPQMHHCPVDDNGLYVLPRDMHNVFLNLVIFAAGSTMENAFFEVNQGYAEIEGSVHQGVVYE